MLIFNAVKIYGVTCINYENFRNKLVECSMNGHEKNSIK